MSDEKLCPVHRGPIAMSGRTKNLNPLSPFFKRFAWNYYRFVHTKKARAEI